MKNFKKLIISATIVGILGVSGTAMASGAFTSPADILADLKGKSVTDVNLEKTTSGKTYGTLANEAGMLEDFQARMLEQKKNLLDQRVKDGQLTAQQAEEIYTAIQNNQATCDGTGSAQLGKSNGLRMGQGNGNGNGKGNGMGQRGSGNMNSSGLGSN